MLKGALEQFVRQFEFIHAPASPHPGHHAVRDVFEHVEQVHVIRHAIGLVEMVTVDFAVVVPPPVCLKPVTKSA